MPELPDVEIYRRALVRKRFESTRRHGKHLFVRIRGGRWLMLHFGMTGSLGRLF